MELDSRPDRSPSTWSPFAAGWRWPRPAVARRAGSNPTPGSPGPAEFTPAAIKRLAGALDEMEIGAGWQVADLLRQAAKSGGVDVSELDELRLDAPNRSFRNLVIGRLAEELFERHCLRPLRNRGYEIRDYRGVYENRDFSIVKDGLELPINVKVVGTRFLMAKEYVGLEPDDCIPISAYKVISAMEKQPDLMYVELVEFGLRERVDGFMESLTGPERTVYDLLSIYGGRGVKRAQDQFIDTLFEREGRKLRALSAGPKNFRAISARRVLSIMQQNPKRCLQISQRAGAFAGDANIHVSCHGETVAWQAVDLILARPHGLKSVLRKLHHIENREQADPEL